MSLKPLHSDCLRRASRTFLRKSSDCMPFFQGLIVSLLSITVNPTPSRLPSPGRCALIIPHFSGSTVVLVRLCTFTLSDPVYLSSIP